MRALLTIGLPVCALLAVAVLIASFLLDQVCCGAPPSPRARRRRPAGWARHRPGLDSPGSRGSRRSALHGPPRRSADARAPSLTCEPYDLGTAFGHLAIGVDDIYGICEKL